MLTAAKLKTTRPALNSWPDIVIAPVDATLTMSVECSKNIMVSGIFEMQKYPM
jgi:hypothetical protein